MAKKKPNGLIEHRYAGLAVALEQQPLSNLTKPSAIVICVTASSLVQNHMAPLQYY